MVKRSSIIDEARVAARVAAAEEGTRAEIVCVVMRSVSDYEYVPLVWAALGALALPALALPLTRWSAETIYLAQLATALALGAVLSWPALRPRLLPRSILRRRAHRAAAEQFLLRGLTRKPDRTGVMIFVAETERYARIIADIGVGASVEPRLWQEVVTTLRGRAREGRLTDGLCEAVDRCGAILAAPLPPRGKPADELSNRVVVL